jgi:hypothetical protein
MQSVVLANRHNIKSVEEELKYDFTISVLQNLELPEQICTECFPEAGITEFTAEHKIKLRSYLGKFNVSILDDHDGGVKYYVDTELVAEWKKPIVKLRRDESVINPADKVFAELHIDFWWMFSEEHNEDNK